ncbi:TonB-dependent receptor [Colwellia psychrerythraea]|uniref:TonB-dependent receptor n=1 Tax=Colwellia psychrerythraea TaxID=28229 RepID=A0A099KJJ2_COLPS|nr:TonB-dependent receptor [Colwellia psychrerythraea]KGJ90435.1 TonB-dependent receptor [Colwellia psychrerythraea]
MSTKSFKKGVLASSIAMILAGVSSQAMAAEKAAVKKDEVEVIQVTGIRGSLKASLNAKRFSNSVVDAVSSEDIGKFPDSDVGESLARIPGVAVNRQFGQGSQVSIRGASAQLTRTLLNGHSVASTGWYDQQDIDRSFNYSMLPSELVGGIEVYKSSQADLVEGGVGGTVIVNTRKPFDLDANTVFASVKGDYGTISEEVDPEVSALYSWKNEDENFGILIAGSVSEKEYQRNGIESLVGWGDIVPSTFQQMRNRTSLNLAVQYAPTEELEFGFTVTSLDLEADNLNTSLFTMFPDDKDAICEQQNADGTCTFYRRPGTGANPGWAQTWARSTGMTSDTYDFDWEYEAENFTVSGRVGNTKSEGGTNLTSNYGFFIGAPADFAGTYDATGDVIAIDIANKSFDASDFNADISSAGWALKKQPNSDEETYVNLDLEVPLELGAISSIKTGIRYADHSVKQQTLNANSSNIVAQDASAFYSGTMSSGAGFTLPKPNFDAMIADSYSFIDGYTEAKDGYGTVEEENLAIYAMADFDADGIRGNFGVRYVKTDASSDFFALDAQGNYADTLSTASTDYSEVLPSINIVFDLAEDVLLRTSAAQVMSRPNYSDMFSSSGLPGYNDGTAGNERVQTGNVALNPFKAFQSDLGVEWYFSEDGMFSATYFLKEVNSFVTTVQKLNQQVGIEDNDLIAAGGSACGDEVYDCWTVINKENATGGKIKGVEMQLQDAFDNGFGYSVNYTYADASSPSSNYPDQVGVFSDSSKHTVNTVGYYENDDFSARLAYNWRSEYMIRESGFYGQREHQDYGTLDLSATWSATDYLDVTFEAANILEEDSVQIGVATGDAEVKPELRHGYPAWSFEGEARYKVGIAVRF